MIIARSECALAYKVYKLRTGAEVPARSSFQIEPRGNLDAGRFQNPMDFVFIESTALFSFSFSQTFFQVVQISPDAIVCRSTIVSAKFFLAHKIVINAGFGVRHSNARMRSRKQHSNTR